jgi:hypothetical protein
MLAASSGGGGEGKLACPEVTSVTVDDGRIRLPRKVPARDHVREVAEEPMTTIAVFTEAVKGDPRTPIAAPHRREAVSERRVGPTVVEWENDAKPR